MAFSLGFRLDKRLPRATQNDIDDAAHGVETTATASGPPWRARQLLDQ